MKIQAVDQNVFETSYISNPCVFITSYSDFNLPLDCAPKRLKGKKLHDWLIRQLSQRERVSTFEIDSDMRVCRTLMYLQRIGKIKLDSKKYGYPYVGVTVTGGKV